MLIFFLGRDVINKNIFFSHLFLSSVLAWIFYILIDYHLF